jgi:dihydroneopterin aldolase
MYKIVIEELSFKAILGVLEKERNEEQLVVVDCKIEYEDKANYVDYSKVCDVIENMIKTNKYVLIEDAVDDIEKKLKEMFPQMRELYLKVTKPEILKNALVGVEILRKY